MSVDQFEKAKEANQKWKYSNERTSESWWKVEALAITIIIKGESKTSPISEIAIIILSLKFIGSFEAAAFSFTK